MLMTARDKEARKAWIMETCFECYCEKGLSETGMMALAKACNLTHPALYAYFENLDALIIESTEHCMAKVEEEFMARAPKSMEELPKFLEETPKWTAQRHGAKYRLMYQIYTMPKYIEHGKRFFAGVQQRYTLYAKSLAAELEIPWEDTEALIFTFVRATVHYALFGEEHYLKAQIGLILRAAEMLRLQYAN